MWQKMIHLENIEKSYTQNGQRHQVLHSIDLTVPAGKIYGIIGESGAGKSTLLRCINLLERPDQGQVWIDGQDICTFSPTALRYARRNIGMIFQHFNLIDTRTVWGNIHLPLELFEPVPDAKARVADLIHRVGLDGLADRYPHQLSGGQKQRVAIARALAHHPKILLCDEATSALDPSTTATILGLLRTLNRDLNLTIVLISHQMAVIKSACDTVGVLQSGRLVEIAPVLTLFASPQTEISKKFVAHTTHMEIPPSIAARMVPIASESTQTLYQFTYIGEVVSEPILSHLITHYHLTINIIQAHIEVIQFQTLGCMMVTLHGQTEAITNGLHFLRSQGLYIEVLGHVQ